VFERETSARNGFDAFASRNTLPAEWVTNYPRQQRLNCTRASQSGKVARETVLACCTENYRAGRVTTGDGAIDRHE